jgi:pimeloyl-ACP methyl ester carboxylesterase
MANPPIYFFHGLESGPVGTKSLRLREDFGEDEVHTPDFEGIMDIERRLEEAERVTRGIDDMLVVGSSFGGLLSALLYSRYPERFHGYVLLAPALYHDVAQSIERMPSNSVVIHGRHDEVVPIDAVRDFCEPYGVPFVEVDDGHRLHESLDRMVEWVERLRERDAEER